MASTQGKQPRSLASGKDDFAGGKASDIVYAGCIVMLDASGRAINGAAATGCIGVGLALTNRGIDRFDGTGKSDGDVKVRWDEGIHCLKNSAIQPFLSTDQAGIIVYIEDNETVSKTDQSTTLSVAGLFHHLDADGAWVMMGKTIGGIAKALTTATDLSAAHLAGSETFTGTKTFGAGLLASGATSNDFSAGTGTFKTSSGANTLSGDTTVAANKFLKLAAGTGVVDASPSSGTFKTSTGLNTIGGDLLMASGKIAAFGAPQALSGAGACNVTSLVTNFTSTGSAQALSLADGTQAGQLKVVHHTVDGGSGVLTPTTAGNFATFTLTNVHDACLLQWTGTAWNIVLNVGGTVA